MEKREVACGQNLLLINAIASSEKGSSRPGHLTPENEKAMLQVLRLHAAAGSGLICKGARQGGSGQAAAACCSCCRCCSGCCGGVPQGGAVAAGCCHGWRGVCGSERGHGLLDAARGAVDEKKEGEKMILLFS